MDAAELLALGYFAGKPLANGEWLALQPQIFTTGLYVVADRSGWRTRYCYERWSDALRALEAWDGSGDPPGPWIKQKPEDRLNPAWLGEIADELAP